MTSLLKNKCLEILKKSTTLEEADKLLSSVFELKQHEKMAIRWGLWDGWRGRPMTLAGLVGERADPGDSVVADYHEACEIGRELSMREMAG